MPSLAEASQEPFRRKIARSAKTALKRSAVTRWSLTSSTISCEIGTSHRKSSPSPASLPSSTSHPSWCSSTRAKARQLRTTATPWETRKSITSEGSTCLEVIHASRTSPGSRPQTPCSSKTRCICRTRPIAHLVSMPATMAANLGPRLRRPR